jgi:carboxyl-terminal processing protease
MVGLTNGIAGFFVDQPNLELGTMRQRGTALRVVVFPRPPTFDGPLAVLIDGGSISSSEILAGGFKALGRARLFGTRTAGASLPSVIEELPSGDRLQYAIADYVAANGERLEGVGVPPHVRVLPDRRSLSEGLDPIEQAALDWIVKQDRQADAAEEDQRPTL